MSFTSAVRDHLLALADDEHMVGARHTSWIGLGPFLEEDLAFCSIAQDELGHAIGLYELLLDGSEGLDRFALMRDPAEYRSCWLAEVECSDWNDSLVRHWLYDRAEALRWDVLAACPHSDVAAFAARAIREESFHLAHAEQVMSRVAATDSTGRIVESIDRLLPIAAGLFDATLDESAAIDEGFLSTSSSDLASQWEQLVRGDLARWGLDIEFPSDDVMAHARSVQRGRTVRSDAFTQLQHDLQRVVALDPSAVW